jgi:hypothetical protein
MLFCIGSGTGLAKFCAVRDRATDDDPGLLTATAPASPSPTKAARCGSVDDEGGDEG